MYKTKNNSESASLSAAANVVGNKQAISGQATQLKDNRSNSATASSAFTMQRLCSKCEEEESESIQRKATSVVQRNPEDIEEQYKYLDSDEQEKYGELAQDVKQEIFKDSKLALSEDASFSKDTEQALLKMLTSVEGLHFGSNPTLGKPWQELVENYSGGKTGGSLYSALRSPGFTKALNQLNIDWKSFAKPPEVHHLIYKKEEPESAVELWNLMLATRGSKTKKVVGQHEGMLHQVSSPPGRPNINQSVYLNEVPGVKGVIKRWAKSGLRPTVQVPNALYNPSYNVFGGQGMGLNQNVFGNLSMPSSDSIFGPEMLMYDPPIVSEYPSLSYLEKDNRFFDRLNYYNGLLDGDDDEHAHWDFLDYEQPIVSDFQFGNSNNFSSFSGTNSFQYQPFGMPSFVDQGDHDMGMEIDNDYSLKNYPLFPELDDMNY